MRLFLYHNTKSFTEARQQQIRPAGSDQMREIKIIFKTHLDIGFTNLARDVRQKYLDEFISKALATADYFRRDPSGFRYRWTVGSWLIREFLRVKTGHELKQLIHAIENGDIVWHALPFTVHSELLTKELFEYSLGFSQELDRRFGKQTIAGKFTDVPGHTRGIIAPLAQAGVKLLHVGINPASAVAKIPAVCRWRDAGGNEIILVYQGDYGTLVELPGSDTAFLVRVTGDNTGPDTPAAVEAEILKLKAEYPGVTVSGGTLDDLAAEALKYRDRYPVLTQEIGDSWIHGVGSDPWKVKRFRGYLEFAKTLEPEFKSHFLEPLTMVAEHTWGLDEKTHFAKQRCAWTAEELEAIADTPECRYFASSWREQRNYLVQAAASLPLFLQDKLSLSLAETETPCRYLSGAPANFGPYQFTVDPAKGCLRNLQINGEAVFSEFGKIVIETFSAADIDQFQHEYLRMTPEWAVWDFGKVGLPQSIQKQTADGFAAEVVYGETDDAWVIELTNRHPAAIYGGAKHVQNVYTLSKHQLKIELVTRITGKRGDRIPHAVWADFTGHHRQLSLQKLGEIIDPRDVVTGGGRQLHAVDGPVTINGKWRLFTSDAPLVAPGKRNLGRFSGEEADISQGIHVNLYNNLWGTNFPMWFDDDMTYRFSVDVD